MGDPYYYNQNYQPYPPVPNNYVPNYAPQQQWNQWGQWQPYPAVMPPYLPPANFNVPPPPMGYGYYNYGPPAPPEPNCSTSSMTPNTEPTDYNKELESYKRSKDQHKDDKYDRRSPHRRERSTERSTRRHRLRSRSPHYSRRNRYRSRESRQPQRPKTSTNERDVILSKWRKNYCSTSEEVSNKIQELEKIDQEESLKQERKIWTRSTPSDLFYNKNDQNPKITVATEKLVEVCEIFEERLVLRAKKINEGKPKYVPPPRKNRARLCKHKSKWCSSIKLCVT